MAASTVSSQPWQIESAGLESAGGGGEKGGLPWQFVVSYGVFACSVPSSLFWRRLRYSTSTI